MLTITIDNLDRLSAEDRRDLAELLREVVCTDQPEHRQAAVDAIEEMDAVSVQRLSYDTSASAYTVGRKAENQ